VFQVTDQALWDGRPSLGGVWVASPDAKDPERVILRNPATGTFVIGALFRREAFNPGPKLQISSDAAAALGLVAGQPATVSVTALRREEVPATTDAENPILDAAESVAGEAIDTQAITTDTIAVAGAALDKVEAQATPAAPVISASPATGSGRTIQIGIFSVEANAKRAADTLGKAGVTASVRKEESQGKVFWSVTVAGSGDGKALLDKVKGLGFTDAYFLRG
jgi:cell division septation protein DedD